MSQSRKYKQSQTLTTDLGLWGASAKQVVQKDNFKVPFFFKIPLGLLGHIRQNLVKQGQGRSEMPQGSKKEDSSDFLSSF